MCIVDGRMRRLVEEQLIVLVVPLEREHVVALLQLSWISGHVPVLVCWIDDQTVRFNSTRSLLHVFVFWHAATEKAACDGRIFLVVV